MPTIINMTRKNLTIFRTLDAEEARSGRCPAIVIPASGETMHLVTREDYMCDLNGMPVIEESLVEVQGEPPVLPDTYYIVPSFVAQRLPDRADFLVPGERIDGRNGHPLGSLGLKAPNAPE